MNTTLSSQSVTRLQISPTAYKLQQAKKIGVSLGAGLPEGFADLGMLIALNQLRIPVGAVSGSSMGGFIGALYATGLDPQTIKNQLAIRLVDASFRDVIQSMWEKDLTDQEDNSGLLADLFVELAGWDPDFRDLKVPLFIVAAEKNSQKPIVIRHGSVKKRPQGGVA